MAYSWEEERRGGGMSSSGGAGFDSAREAYRTPVSTATLRSSVGVSARSSAAEDSVRHLPTAMPGATPRPLGVRLATDSTHPIVVLCDHTGSMGTWPGIILEKLALLGKEVERYAPNYAISFGFIGDTRCDTYGLQVRDFANGPALDEHLGMLYPEGGGGDNEESYGVAAYYYLNKCDIHDAVKPILMMILDAPDHGDIRPSEVKAYIGDDLDQPLSTKAVFDQLMEKFQVYIISAKGGARSYWEPIVGAQRFVSIDEPRDIVEVLIGIVAGELGEFKDFALRSSTRHSDRPDRVSRVEKSLRSVREASEKLSSSTGARAGAEDVDPSLRSKKLI